MCNKRGSTSIFLVFILTAIVGLTAAFIFAAKQAAISSYGDGLLNLAGRSVLSEFDLKLKDTYGIFAFDQQGKEVENEIRNDVEYALRKNRDAKLGKLKADLSEHSLGAVDEFKEQILDYMKFAIAEDIIGAKNKTGESKESHPKDRTLRNRKIINSLPSKPFRGSGPGFIEWVKDLKEHLSSFDQIFNQEKDAYLLNRYILLHFKNALGGPTDRETFFSNEVEYILEGDYSNKKNKSEIRKGLVLFRTGLNAAHLYLDGEKRALTLAAAEALTPGPAALVTQAVIVGTWAVAEAENDTKLLEKGKPVVLFKDKTTWATDLDAVLNNHLKGCIDTGSKRGLSYEDYLMIFLFFQDEPVKLARVMDLIQINMRGTCRDSFTLKTYSCGFGLEAELNRKRYIYDQKY